MLSKITECRLSDLMRIAIESLKTLIEQDVEEIFDIWNRKPQRLSI